jgi:RNA repair pathway DNA polymerase beta family protein
VYVASNALFLAANLILPRAAAFLRNYGGERESVPCSNSDWDESSDAAARPGRRRHAQPLDPGAQLPRAVPRGTGGDLQPRGAHNIQTSSSRGARRPESADLYRFVVYRCIVGSTAYGISQEGSDVDRRGFYLPPADLEWSLAGVPEQLENDQEETKEET